VFDVDFIDEDVACFRGLTNRPGSLIMKYSGVHIAGGLQSSLI